MRDLVLQAAGFDEKEVARFMRLAADKLIEKLDAKTTKILSHEGEETGRIELEDNAAQIRAAKELKDLGIDIAGLRTKVDGNNKPPSHVTVDLSGWNIHTEKDAPPVSVKTDAPDTTLD
jgi:hypothetical protein